MTASDWVSLVGQVAWPLTVLALGLALRRQIGAFLTATAGRITRLSVMSVSLDLAVATEASPPWHSSIDGSDVRGLVPAHNVNDSYFNTLRESLLNAAPADFIVVDLKSESAREWLTSRLYLFTYLLGHLKGVRAVVFVATRGDTNRVFLGVAHSDELLGVLAQQSPRFRLARLQAESEQVGRLDPDSESPWVAPTRVPPTTIDPAVPEDLDEWWIRTAATLSVDPLKIAERFLMRLQWDPQPPIPPDVPPGWLRLPSNPDLPDGPEVWEYASWVTASDLTDGFLAPVIRPDDWLVDEHGWSPEERVRLVAQARGDLVALLSASRRFERLVDRRALLESLGTNSVVPSSDA